MRKRSSRFILCSFAAALAMCVVGSGSGLAQSAAARDIHGVDFRNFGYSPSCMNLVGSTKVAVKTVNGSYTKKDPADEVTFRVNDVVYGDLNGDGMDEAVVLTVCNTGGSGWFDDGFLYAMRNEKPVLLSQIQGGDRAYGGIRGVRIESGLLKVERLQPEIAGGAVGVGFIETTTYRLSGSKLLRVGRTVRRSFRGGSRAKRIQFERGSSSAVLTGTTSGADFYVLSARQNQTLTVRITSTLNNAHFEISVDDFTAAYRATEWSGKLDLGGDYTIVVVSEKGSCDYTLEVAVR